MNDVPKIVQFDRSGDDGNSQPTTWVDLDLRDDNAADWIERESDLTMEVVNRLLERDNICRRELIGEGLLLRFRTPDWSPTTKGQVDTFCIWVEPTRVITTRWLEVPACEALHAAASDGTGQMAPFEIVAFLLRRNVERFEAIINDLLTSTSQLEDRVMDADDEEVDDDLLTVRRRTIHARQYLVEFRNLLSFTTSDQDIPLTRRERRSLDSAKNHVFTFLESLDDCQGRARLLQDQVAGRIAEKLNRITYNLTLVATIFLPMSFLTGLLGMNVAGIPEEHDPRAFAIVCIILVLMAIGFWMFFRWRRWV